MDDDRVNRAGLGAADDEDEDELDYDLDYSAVNRADGEVTASRDASVDDADPLDVNGDGVISPAEAVAGVTKSDTEASEAMIEDGGESAEADLIQRRNSLL